VGEDTADIPANKRFYAGGGGSIRGYKFQKVGPLNDNRDPIGGRSLFEVGAELRTRVWGNFSVIPFIEGGNVFEASYPDFSDAPRWGAGVGLGYRTAIGPVRLDFAFPLNRRKDIDDTFQFYVALGQPF
jgi:translocation and assembly module TamA